MKNDLQDHAPLLERAFALTPADADYRIDGIEGTVPGYLRGSYYVNGPAGFGRGAVRYRHWLDGDGMVCALHFDADGVRFVARFVRSAKRVAEEEAGKALFRAFGTAFEGDQLKRGLGLESPVNVSVYPWAGTLLAFGEQGLPWELDPLTLETRGEYTFNRRLNAVSPLSAHPKIDYPSGEMFNFGISFSPRSPSLTLYRFAADGELRYRQRLPIPYPCSVHDFGLGPRHVVFYLSPHVLDIQAFLRQGQSLQEALAWRPEARGRMLVIDRERGELLCTITLEDRYCLHTIDCFDLEDGRLALDIVELERPVYDQYDLPQLFTEVRRAQPMRYVIDVEGGRIVERQGLDYRLMCDFPAIDQRRTCTDYRHLWVLGIAATEQPGRKFFDQVVHCDWHRGGVAGVYQAPPRCYLGGEPVFLPDLDDPEAGAVICQQFDAERERSSFLIFDAFDLGRGPLARLPLEAPVPLLFHASYDPAGAAP